MDEFVKFMAGVWAASVRRRGSFPAHSAMRQAFLPHSPELMVECGGKSDSRPKFGTHAQGGWEVLKRVVRSKAAAEQQKWNSLRACRSL